VTSSVAFSLCRLHQHQHRVGRTGQPVAARHRVDEVAGLSLAGMVHDHQRRARPRRHRVFELTADQIVEPVHMLAGWSGRFHLAEGVQNDQRFGVGVTHQERCHHRDNIGRFGIGDDVHVSRD
jgi:hypothetical protein